MRENFIYDKYNKPKEKKYYRYFYPIHCSIKKEMEQFLEKANNSSLNLKLDDVKIAMDSLPMELETIIYLVDDIFAKRFPEQFRKKFITLNKMDLIKYYDVESTYLCEKYSSMIGNCAYVDTELFYSYIYIELNGDVRDLYALSHEIGHFMIGGFDELLSKEYFAELIPIFSELVVFDYMLEHFPNHPSIFELINNRFYEMNETFEYLKNYNQYSDCFDYFDRFKYLFSFVLAIKLYGEYLNNREETMIKVTKFGKGLGKLHFNRLMKILGLKVKYADGKLSIKEETVDKIMTEVNDVIEYINEQFQIVVSNKEKEVSKKYVKKRMDR